MAATETSRHPSGPGSFYKKFPNDPAAYFSSEEIAKAKRYQKTNTILRIVNSVINLAALIALILTGAVEYVFNLLGFTGWASQVLASIGTILMATTIATVPVDIYREFVHEKRWGFSKQTPARWLGDQVKGLLVGQVLLGSLFVALWWVIRATELWWLIGAIIMIVFSVLIAFIAPIVLLPIFNKLTPLEDENLHDRLLGLARSAGVPVKTIMVMDASKRTTKDNAAFTGLGASRRIVLFDNLLERPAEEIAVVVAHEAGHWRRRHILKSLVLSTILFATLFWVLSWAMSYGPLLDVAGVSSIQDPASIPTFLAVMGVGFFVTSFLQAWISRGYERQADTDALAITGDHPAYMSAMRGLATKNLSDLVPGWWAYIRADHPPIAERLAWGDAWAERSGTASGEVGAARVDDVGVG